MTKLIEDAYSSEDMSDLQVPEILDINDATLEDGTLTLYCTIQYEEGDREDCTFVIDGFTGKTGTYDLVMKDDKLLDVEEGDITVDADVIGESLVVSNIKYDINIKGKRRNGSLVENFSLAKSNK